VDTSDTSSASETSDTLSDSETSNSCDAEYYTDAVETISPSNYEQSYYLYIQSILPIEKIKKVLKSAKKLVPKVLYCIYRLSKTNDTYALLRFNEPVTDSDTLEIKRGLTGTGSYVYFPHQRVELVIDFMDRNASVSSSFVIDGECDLNITSILKYKAIARDLVKKNNMCGIETTPNLIRDKIIRTYLDETKTRFDIGDFLDKFGYYGLRLSKYMSDGK